MKCFYPVLSGGQLRPCGMCQVCLINKQLSWKFRLKHEVLQSDVAFWLTLQYDDEHLPRSNGIPCVCKLHCQNYFRQIRKQLIRENIKVTFKYFLTSEYGPTTHRPHYHVLLLFTLPQTSFKSMLELRQTLYELCKVRWYHGHVQESLFHSGVIGYLTKYVFKTSDDYDPPVPCFRLISKGIGESYLTKIDKQAVIRDEWRTPDGLLPRYYRDKLFPTMTAWNTPIIDNKNIRSDIFTRTLDKIYKKASRDLDEAGSLEAYEKKQNYLLACQKRLFERKQKQKYD